MMLLAGNFGKRETRGVETGLGAHPGGACGNNGPMSEPWLESKTPIGPPTSANPTVRQLLYAAAVTGGWSALLSLLIYLVARLFGADFEIAVQGSSEPQPLPWLMVLLLPLAAAVVFALLGSLLRGVRHAGRIVYWAGTLVAIASLIGPLAQPGDVGWGTRIALVLMHVVTWFLVVPQIARIIGDSEPGKSVERDEQD